MILLVSRQSGVCAAVKGLPHRPGCRLLCVREMDRLRRSKTARFGLPMLMDPALEAQIKKNKNKITLDSEYQKLPDANSDWVNIRGPRPWEDSKTVQDQQRKIQIGSSIK
ncbi:cytochrome c oxidase assembly protein COX16 homolog, mitochondrial isoform X2 [Narcine bancroftii]|uniref:cytochrome c oxidase assembly protein COX16 homolog, mitochondrial isoform X2 n=1 Tax=Narcine bancroftii TaxID=1343680 RepID=UPI0038312A1E